MAKDEVFQLISQSLRESRNSLGQIANQLRSQHNMADELASVCNFKAKRPRLILLCFGRIVKDGPHN